ncbi:MAG: ABC transporter ATP-binding protein [Bacillota bacterium]|nr:MAG: ABC transporter ATP-binding protein [Bacillota bacterium]
MLVCEDLVKTYRTRRSVGPARPAVDGVSLGVAPGETFALVGESGCGKTTVARMAVGLLRPASGRILLEGRDLARMRGRELMTLRRQVQIVFQDPAGALDPRQTVGGAVAEPLLLHRLGGPSWRRRETERLFRQVGLGPREMGRFPHQLSGGQKQRVLIARALSLRPRYIILDEPVSALDVSVRAQILNLLAAIQAELGLGYLLISHDLAVVRNVASRAAVMHRGRLVEEGPVEEVWSRPAHPYTRALLKAIPVPDPALRPEPPSSPPPEPEADPVGARADSCLYESLCPRSARLCRRRRPRPERADHWVACHYPLILRRRDDPGPPR